MEAVSAVVFIGAVVIGVVDFLKRIFPEEGQKRDTRGALTIVGAALVGLVVSIFDAQLGVLAITPAQGVLAGLAASGTYQTVKQIG